MPLRLPHHGGRVNVNFLSLDGVPFYWKWDACGVHPKEGLVHIYEKCSALQWWPGQVRSGSLSRARRLGVPCQVCTARFAQARYEGAQLDALRKGKTLRMING